MRTVVESVLENFPDRKDTTLPLLFINREGDPETGEQPGSENNVSPARRPSGLPVSVDGGIEPCESLPWEAQSEAAAGCRLRRALHETGQLRVLPQDGLSQVCFTGIGDPEQLFVESLPADSLVPSVDFDGPGRLCSLAQAEAILRQLYRGETSSALGVFLNERQRLREGDEQCVLESSGY
jgi:hypothetical protein